MNFIPYARLIFGIVAFGMSFFLFDNVYSMLTDIPYFALQTSGPTYTFLVMIWMGLPLVYIFYASIRLIMDVQRRQPQ